MLLAPDRPRIVPAHPRSALDRRGFLAAGALAGLTAVTGCSPAGPAGDAPADGRTVEHPLGTAVVPAAPQRIVSLDSNGGLQVALELGVPLIASETLQGAAPVPPYLPAPPADFTPLGFNQLNLEQLVAMGPDLIIGNTSRVEEHYDRLAAIAPTVAYANSGSGAVWQEAVRTIGDVLGAEEEIERRLAGYTERLDQVRSAHAGLLDRYTVTLLRFTTDELRIVRGQVFGSAILADAGATRPPSTELPSPQETHVPIGDESVGALADADVLLYFLGGGGLVDQADETFERYTTGGLWEQLPAVRAGRVAQVDPLAWWDGYSVSAGLACLDELDRVLGDLPV
ncbi:MULTISPECIES: iron-siderophore ABC transporter substrate-binding protein [Pseudonocardia]|uniref:Putative siderophore-binding lipoprotein YfiY n=1 Tax=Pseudonocardia autotrophica TaxID=2074 RepID=A0A1Y2MWF4_PSEAH|nr:MULTISPECIES: iron-siderophore ABC transporter substrate-binding protein [Pseudonocardia]OSY39520.1 putative siderophore-binding lipoprotein YfiY precursor [Pseudonocardia autotrophica]TDN75242.1 iron complex transport system substrate-binding protein [Pseudonocardia autotrophica]